MAKYICGTKSDKLYQALVDGGVIPDDPDYVSRVVIDLKVGNPATVYVQKFLDDSLADVLLSAGITDLEEATA